MTQELLLFGILKTFCAKYYNLNLRFKTSIQTHIIKMTYNYNQTISFSTQNYSFKIKFLVFQHSRVELAL